MPASHLINSGSLYRSERTEGDWQKSIVNTRFRIEQIDVHISDVEGISGGLCVLPCDESL